MGWWWGKDESFEDEGEDPDGSGVKVVRVGRVEFVASLAGKDAGLKGGVVGVEDISFKAKGDLVD